MMDLALERFQRDGFAVLRGYLSPDEVEHLRAGFARFVAEIAPRLDRRAVMYEDYGDRSTIKQSHALDEEPSLAAWKSHGKIHDLAEAMLGPVRAQNVEYFDKPVGRNHATPPHQDGYYFCLRPNEALTVWIPLEPIDEENGALVYVKGSHRFGVREHGASNILGFSQGLLEDPLNFGEPVVCTVSPGDVLVHHSLTVHYAGANRSTRRRPVIAYTYFSKRAERDEEAKARYEAALLKQHAAKGLVATPGSGS
jgi:phytanoyl-CoA hydroxylase